MGSRNINSREDFIDYVKKYQVQFEIAVKKYSAIETAYKKMIAALELPAPDFASEADAEAYRRLSADAAKSLSANWGRFSSEMDRSIAYTRAAFKRATTR